MREHGRAVESESVCHRADTPRGSGRTEARRQRILAGRLCEAIRLIAHLCTPRAYYASRHAVTTPRLDGPPVQTEIGSAVEGDSVREAVRPVQQVLRVLRLVREQSVKILLPRCSRPGVMVLGGY
jgi:hypothetical protein